LAKETQSPSEYKELKKFKESVEKLETNSLISGQYQSRRKKYFYKFIKALRKDPCSIPTLLKDSLTYNSNLDKSNILNKHFYSVFNKESSATLPDMGPSPYPEMASFDIFVTGVVRLLQEVDPFKATEVWRDWAII